MSAAADPHSVAREDCLATPDEEQQGVEEEEEEEEIVAEVSFKKHIQYFKRVLAVLPCSLSSLDSSRFLVNRLQTHYIMNDTTELSYAMPSLVYLYQLLALIIIAELALFSVCPSE